MNAADITAWARLWRAAFGVPVLVTAATADLLEDIGVEAAEA